MTTNASLSALLGIRSTLDYRTVAAEVIGREISQSERVVTLSSGSDQGISVGDVVLADGGALVGRVVEVGPNFSRVLLISDTRSTVIGLVEPSRATGNIQGQLGGALLMTQIPTTEEVKVDDEVVTAGIDLGDGVRSPFPKGLLVGRVVDVQRDAASVVQIALVDPAVALDKLEYVLVITDYEGGIPIGPEPSASPGGEGGGSGPSELARALAVGLTGRPADRAALAVAPARALTRGPASGRRQGSGVGVGMTSCCPTSMRLAFLS